jgi:hypothetical protein
MELADQETRKPEIHKPVNTGIQGPRIKCTYDLSQNTVEGLEEARLKLRRMVGRNVKRYEIIEASLKLALEDPERLAGRL